MVLGFWCLFAFSTPPEDQERKSEQEKALTEQAPQPDQENTTKSNIFSPIVVVGLILALVIGHQIYRFCYEVTYIISDENRAWRLYNPWGINTITIEPDVLRVTILGQVSTEIKFNSSSEIMLPGDPELVTPYKVVKVNQEVLTIKIQDRGWKILNPPSALSLGYGKAEAALMHAGYMLPEHRFTGWYWDVPRMNQTQWLNHEAKKDTDCWVYSGVSWFPAKIVSISDEYGIRVTYDPQVTAKWVCLEQDCSNGYTEWVAPYRVQERSPEKPSRLPDYDQ